MKKTSEHCDVCGKRIDFLDVDGDYHINGIRLSQSDKTEVGVLVARADFHVTPGAYSGFTETFCRGVVCSPVCLADAFRQFTSLIAAKWPTAPVLNNE